MPKKIINNTISNWVNNNKELLRAYKNKWIAYTVEEGLIGYADELFELRKKIDKPKRDYVVYFVNPEHFKLRFLPIHFRTVIAHDWQPTHEITLTFKNNQISLLMLIDSGADCSLISYQTGLDLGLNYSDGEHKFQANGVGGGVVNYVVRDVDVTIESQTIKVPIAWVLDEDCHEEIIGREVVFDKFDIEFKQADEAIIFRYRK